MGFHSFIEDVTLEAGKDVGKTKFLSWVEAGERTLEARKPLYRQFPSSNVSKGNRLVGTGNGEAIYDLFPLLTFG